MATASVADVSTAVSPNVSTAVRTGVELASGTPPQSAPIERALGLLRRAVGECGYTGDELEASMRRSRAHIYRVLHGQTPMSLRFFFALPVDVEARFEQLRLEHVGAVLRSAAAT